MKTIYKYPLAITDKQNLDLPYGSEILSVANQNENLVLYALVDTEQQMMTRHFINIYGTGNPTEQFEYDGFEFLGTVLMANGSLVWHVFYVTS